VNTKLKAYFLIDKLKKKFFNYISNIALKYKNQIILLSTAEDLDSYEKAIKIAKNIKNFGSADFAELSCYLFSSSLQNHKIIHQRIDEASLLWRAIKNSAGPILEIGRAAGGSTILILGASNNRKVISIDSSSFESNYTSQIFNRPDVQDRLTLYNQTSRDEINEKEFGAIFFDGDHSYEGICVDIGNFWNKLKSYSGKPAYAIFHDGHENQITFVETVKHAVDELLQEKAAKKIENWGSLVVLEKLKDIDQNIWFKKTHVAYWETNFDLKNHLINPIKIKTRLFESKNQFEYHLNNDNNKVGKANVDHDFWLKKNVRFISNLKLNSDNPYRLFQIISGYSDAFLTRSFVFPKEGKLLIIVKPFNIEVLTVEISNNEQKISILKFEISFLHNSIKLVDTKKDQIKIFNIISTYKCSFYEIEIFYKANDIYNYNLTLAFKKAFNENKRCGVFTNLINLRKIDFLS
jgi:hypothetical protein